MTIAALILTCLLFVALGWTGDSMLADRAVRGSYRVHRCRKRGNDVAGPQDRLHRGCDTCLPADWTHHRVLASGLIIGLTTLYMHDVFGIGSPAVPAPQATLMSTIITGLLNQNLPWGLVLVGIFIAITLELCGVHSLSFAVGLYCQSPRRPQSSSAASSGGGSTARHGSRNPTWGRARCLAQG